METILLATIGLGIMAKFIENKLEQTAKHEWNSLETLNTEVVKQNAYSNFESY